MSQMRNSIKRSNVEWFNRLGVQASGDRIVPGWVGRMQFAWSRASNLGCNSGGWAPKVLRGGGSYLV